ETNNALKDAGLPEISEAIPLWRYVRRPEVRVKDCAPFGGLNGFSRDEVRRAEIEVKYEGYIERQNKWIQQLAKVEEMALEKEMDYEGIPGLSKELQLKLGEVKPLTFGQASRISGMTPAALSILMIHLKARAAGKR
ncbi:MAG: tRNA uridine-5-carboxymethylaminomethyl(34) synthesis enzyme MnmG, partial [Nitrospinota bacterium]